MRVFTLSPLGQNKSTIQQTACHSHLFSNSLTFQVLSKFPWPSTKFPDFPLTLKKSIFRYFSLTVVTLLQDNMMVDVSTSCHITDKVREKAFFIKYYFFLWFPALQKQDNEWDFLFTARQSRSCTMTKL